MVICSGSACGEPPLAPNLRLADNGYMDSALPVPSPVLDIAVVGAGPVGLALAAALKQAMGGRLKIAAIDPAPERGDGGLRTVALSAGSRAFFERLGAWSALEPRAQPILAMDIYDGAIDDVVRLKSLSFEASSGDALAHMAFNDDVAAALRKVAATLGVETIEGAVEDFTPGPYVATLTLVGGGSIKARLVVAADGANSKMRRLADLATVGWDTGQSGIVATIGHTHDHEGRAEQHFLPAGPFAILPLRGRRSSIVWNERHADAQALAALSPGLFLAELERRFTLKRGALSLESAIRAYPLSFRFARRYYADRLALVGDAAHTVHPLAGQGLNLGLRDVAALAEILVDRLRLGLDPGEPGVLTEYQQRRRFDVVASSFGMDAMNRLFSNDNPALRIVRDLGLRAVDRAPALKRRFAAEAAGAGANAPRLLRGFGL